MRMNLTTIALRVLRWTRRRLGAEHGFTMMIALGVLTVTGLLLAAAFIAINGDTNQTQHDLDGKRAYLAARAGVNAYLYELNQNPNYWLTCANDTKGSPTNPVQLPATSTGVAYSWQPIYNPGYSSCSTNPIAALIDPGTGTLRLEFVGYSGTHPQVQRGIVASFRKDSPLDFLWYTVYEASDSSINGFTGCDRYYRDPRGRNSVCNIYWVSADSMRGPMYTKDQYLVTGYSPTFGRDANDKIESLAPGTNAGAICAGNTCGSAIIKGTAVPNAPDISPPSDNSALLTDAQNHGVVVPGTSTITLNSTNDTADVWNCPTTSAGQNCGHQVVDLTAKPIIYVTNGCGVTDYTPFAVSYPVTTSPSTTLNHYYGCEGNAYVSGSYDVPVTIASANDILIANNITTTEDSSGPTGGATLGLVANRFVRVMHAVSQRQSASRGGCGTAANTFQLPNPTKIDAAILALQHSFIVDNFDCGNSLGTLTVNGAIAQFFRGAVGTTGGTGYVKNYSYDDRLAVLLPPFLFDIATSGWHTVRETLCIPVPAACT
jgi:hypothetical protein